MYVALDVVLVGIWVAATAVAVTDCGSTCGLGMSSGGSAFNLQSGNSMCSCSGAGMAVKQRALGELAARAASYAEAARRGLFARQNDGSDNDNDDDNGAAPVVIRMIERMGTQQARLGVSAAAIAAAVGAVGADLFGHGGKPPMPKMPQLRMPQSSA